MTEPERPSDQHDRTLSGRSMTIVSLRLNSCHRSGSLLDRRIAGSGWSSGAFRASGARRDGFRWVGGSPDVCTQKTKPPPNARRGQHGRIARPFPGQSAVVDEAAGQPQLGVGGNDEPGPTVGLCGGADAACSPAQRSLDEAKRMLDVKNVASRRASTGRGRAHRPQTTTATAPSANVPLPWEGARPRRG